MPNEVTTTKESNVEHLPAKAQSAHNIYQRINEVRKKVNYVRKEKEVSTGSGGKAYKATTHDAVTALVRNHLIEHGVLIVPKLTSSSVSVAGETQYGTTIIRYEAKYDIEFTNCDQPDDKIIVPSEAHANDTGDKAPGKAVSYATKAVILKIFNIETGEDEESRIDPYGGHPVITEEQAAEIEAKLTDNEVDMDSFMLWAEKEWKIKALGEMRAKSFAACTKQLDAMIAARKAKPKKQANA